MHYWGLILFIILIIIIVIMLWLAWYTSSGQGQKQTTAQASGQDIGQASLQSGYSGRTSKNTSALAKFSLAEHEIDTLLRSYIIETFCACQEACITFERIEHLCEKAGEYLAAGGDYDHDFAQTYAKIRKNICQEFKKCVDSKKINTSKWHEHNTELIHHVASRVKTSPKDLLISTRKKHTETVAKLIKSHIDKDNLQGMVLYDSLREKTDTYVETINYHVLAIVTSSDS